MVEVPGPVQFVPVPAELLTEYPPSDLPQQMSWLDAVQHGILDRAQLASCNAALRAIGGLDDRP